MNRTIPLAVLALGSLTACTRVVEVQAPVQVTAAPTTEALSSEDAELERLADRMIADVYDLIDGPVYATDAEIIRLAIAMCEGLDDGGTLDELNQAMAEAAEGDRDFESLFAAVTVVAIMDLCPHHEWMLEQLSA